jgi:S1-C subfamily serine protease
MTLNVRDALHTVADEAARQAPPVADWLTPVRARIKRRERQRRTGAATALILFGVLIGSVAAGSGRSPKPSLAAAPDAVRAAEAAVVRVLPAKGSCADSAPTNGFFYKPHRVMTTAHSVAGAADGLQVEASDGRRAAAVVVVFDPERDVAVLRVDGLDEAALGFDDHSAAGRSAYLVTHADNGEQRYEQVTVGSKHIARGPDFYQRRIVTRRIYQFRTSLRAGVAGSPLLSSRGAVLGMTFAAGPGSRDVAYALVATELSAAGRQGTGATAPTTPRDCPPS